MAKIGRPTVDTEAITVRLPRAAIDALDSYRKTEPDLPTRPEGIRRILIAALELKGHLPK